MARPGDVIENPAVGDRVVFRRTRDETGGALLEFDLHARPGAAGPPAHVHPESEERFRVLEGELRATVDGRELTLAAGDAVTVPAGVPHTWWNAGASEARVRVTVAPEAGMEAFLETMYGLAQDGRTNAAGVPSPLQLAVTAPAFFGASHLARPPLAVQRAVFGVLGPIARLFGYRARYPYPHRAPEPSA